MINALEDPRKTDLTAKVRVALDAGGYRLVDPVPIDLPADAQLQGRILGDLQTVDGDGVRAAYYVRLEGNRAIPQWVANLATASHSLERIRVYVVVEESTGLLEQSCRVSGSGLLVLRAAEDYRLDVLIDPSQYDPAQQDQQIKARARGLRRRLDSKLRLNLEATKEDYLAVRKVGSAVASELRDEYLGAVEDVDARWREWGDQLSARLDEAVARSDGTQLDVVEAMIEAGAIDVSNDG